MLGLIIAPLLFVALMAWGLLTWFRTGRDPVYLDDPSIHIPAPPKGLTPAAGAAVRDGKVTRRALTAASLDLAVRGHITFDAEEKRGLFASGVDMGIRTGDALPDDAAERARMLWARNREMDDATEFLLRRLRSIGGGAQLRQPGGAPQAGHGRGGVRQAARDPLHAAGLVPRAAGVGERPLDRARDRGRSSSA